MDKTYRFLLRMPEELRARLKAAADRREASLNTEIVTRLQASFVSPTGESHRTRENLMNRRVLLAVAVVALAAVLAAVAGHVTRSGGPTVVRSNESLGARANAIAHLGRSESGEAEVQ